MNFRGSISETKPRSKFKHYKQTRPIFTMKFKLTVYSVLCVSLVLTQLILANTGLLLLDYQPSILKRVVFLDRLSEIVMGINSAKLNALLIAYGLIGLFFQLMIALKVTGKLLSKVFGLLLKTLCLGMLAGTIYLVVKYYDYGVRAYRVYQLLQQEDMNKGTHIG